MQSAWYYCKWFVKRGGNQCGSLQQRIRKELTWNGKAKGADELGERFAREYDLGVEEYPAKWNDLTVEPCKIKYNKWGKPYNCLAGINRNTDMINVSDLIIMFHDGKSNGTLDDLNKCKKMDKDYEYILF